MSEKSFTVDDILVAGSAAFPGNGTPFPVTTGNSTHGRPGAAENAAGPFLRRGARSEQKPRDVGTSLVIRQVQQVQMEGDVCL